MGLVLGDGSWQYVRLTPEARGYLPLPLKMVIAFRFSLGAMFIVGADGALLESAQKLGPEQYRLRGGGPSSHRGYLPGDLGDGIEGGPEFVDFLGGQPAGWIHGRLHRPA